MSEISYDNFEGFGGDYTRQHRDSIDLVNEIEELKYSNRKLQDENDRLSSQISHADDAYQAIIQENTILKRRAENMQVVIGNVKDLEKEYDEMKESFNNTKAENDHLKTNISENERQRLFFQGKAEHLEKKLQQVEEDLNNIRLEEKKLLCIIENQEKALIKAEGHIKRLEEDLILKDEKCKEMETIVNQYKEVLENLRSEKTAIEYSLLNFQKNIASQVTNEDSEHSDDTMSVSGEQELFEDWRTEEWSYRNLKDELQEVIENEEVKSSYSNALLNLQNIFKTIYAALKDAVSTLSRVNSQAASILELENVKESKEKEDPKALLEREPAKDSFDESIQEQINAELKALRAQIARSQAVLAFLQTKGSSLPHGIEQHSTKWPPQSLEITEVDTPGNLELYMGYLQQDHALSELSERPRFVRHRNPPNRSNSSTASQKAVPLHRSPLALSCPILPSQTSLVTRATQTEPVNSTIISVGQTHDKKFESAVPLGYDADFTAETKTVSSHNVTTINSSSSCEMNSAIKGIRTCLLAVPNAYQFQEGADSPISPSFPRNRSFSFVTAIRKGNPNLVDATDSCHYLNTEINISSSTNDSFVRDNQTTLLDAMPIKVPNTPPPIVTTSTHFNTMKEIRPYIYPSEDTECNRFATCTRSNSSCPSRSLHTMHSVPPYPKAPEFMKFQTDTKQGKRINEISTAAGDCKENHFEDENTNKGKDEVKNSTDRDSKMYKHTKRRLSGSGLSNSSPGIVRCPAFDFSEQDDDVTTTAALQVTGNIKRRDTTNKCKVLMPDLKENSETESAKGSANGSFEYEAGDTTASSHQIEITTGTDPAFPSLPDSFLKRLGIHKSTPISLESLSDEEIEAKFNTLSLAFKTDKYTLAKRMELHQRQRDITEKNIESELNALKELITDLGQHYVEGEPKELVCKMQSHVDIIEQSTSRMSSRAEIFGSVQQEERLSQAVEIMVNHVENIRRVYKKEHQELEDMRNLWNESKAFDDNSGDSAGEEGKRSLRSLIMASTASKQETTDSISSSHSTVAKSSSCWNRNSESFIYTNAYNFPAFGHFSFTSISHEWSSLNFPVRTDCPPVIEIATAHSALEAFVGSSEKRSYIELLPNQHRNRKAVCHSIDKQRSPKLNEIYTSGNDAKGDASYHHSKNDRKNFSQRVSKCKVNWILHRRWERFSRFPLMGFLISLSILTVIMWIVVSFTSVSSFSCFKDSALNWSWLDTFKRIFDQLIVVKHNNVPPI